MKKRLILKALTDPKFRELLSVNPQKALNAEELAEIKGGQGVLEILDIVGTVNAQSTKVSDYLFCVIRFDSDIYGAN